MRPTSNASGSILFYILIGVAMFAALSYGVAHIMQGGGSMTPSELKTASAGGILQYSDAVRNAVRTMQIDGIDAGKICFDSPNWGNTSYNYAACTDVATNVFHPNGGGVTWEKNDSTTTNDGSAWLYTGSNGVKDVGSTCAASACADLKMVLPNVTRATCMALNDQLGIANPGGEPPVDTGYEATPFIGVYASTGTADIGDEAGSTGLAGKLSGCFKSSTSPTAGTYHFYRVLLSR